MEWNGNKEIFKTYVKGKSSGSGKRPAERVKDRDHIADFEEVCSEDCFGGILQPGIIDISFDTKEMYDTFLQMAEDNEWKCLALPSSKGGHTYWRCSKRYLKNGSDKKLAVGLVADLHSGSTYIPLCVHGEKRFPPDYDIYDEEDYQEVPDEFHPRYTDCIKTYQYNILNSRYNVPTLRLYYDYVYYPLDVDLMRKGAQYLTGEHDFTAFSSSGGQQKTSVRNIYNIDLESEWLDQGPDKENEEPVKGLQMPKLIHISISGNGFLYNMVRIIAGTLEKVGMGVYPPEHVKEILDSKDRRLSAPKAPARGLTLMGITYL